SCCRIPYLFPTRLNLNGLVLRELTAIPLPFRPSLRHGCLGCTAGLWRGHFFRDDCFFSLPFLKRLPICSVWQFRSLKGKITGGVCCFFGGVLYLFVRVFLCVAFSISRIAQVLPCPSALRLGLVGGMLHNFF